MTTARRRLRSALLPSLFLCACSSSTPARLVVRLSSAESSVRPKTVVLYVRDDGPPRAVGARALTPSPTELVPGGAALELTLEPSIPFLGAVTLYAVGCAEAATCALDAPTAPDCVCANVISIGAATTTVSGHTTVGVVLTSLPPGCDPDGDLSVDCDARVDCCASLNPEAAAAVDDCLDARPILPCLSPPCGTAIASPFRPTEVTPEQAGTDPLLVRRNLVFCADAFDNDCVGGPVIDCARIDADDDGSYVPEDCDDGLGTVYPGAPEICGDAVDQNCDGETACDEDEDGSPSTEDCDDTDDRRAPGNLEICGDGVDQDCDLIDRLCVTDDLDRDGSPCPGVLPNSDHRCAGPGLDCNDLEASVHPGAPERCGDGIDQDCDGVDLPCQRDDVDLDGERGQLSGGTDCNDGDAGIFTGAPDKCGDGIDQDCTGLDAVCSPDLDADGDGFRAEDDCDDGSSARAPGAVEHCNGIDDDCDGVPDEGNPLTNAPGGAAQPVVCGSRCPSREEPCTCFEAPSVCTALEPNLALKVVVCLGVAAGANLETESAHCNGIDDDCDGARDEDLRRPCYDGPAMTEGVGRCRGGTQGCNSERGSGILSFGACEQQYIPPIAPTPPEICNLMDDDCDAQVDEDAQGGPYVEVCSDFPMALVGAGICRAGLRTCNNGALSECDGDVGPQPETCDGVDSDCVGGVDATERGPIRMRCYPDGVDGRGVGACMDGTAVCFGGQWQACGGAITPMPEACNNVDDDCDGAVDDLMRACGHAAVGACRRGMERCQGGRWAVCQGDVAPVVEVCNNVDDDCDGSVDENLVTACGSAVGVCSEGTQTCAGGSLSACVGGVMATAESCNRLDDDCDGTQDEGFDVGSNCSAGAGACLRQGMRVCTADGRAVVCGAVAGPASPEICNGLDDDCDGSTDQGFADLGSACNAGIGACLRQGMRVCSANGSAVVCGAIPGLGSAESCNGLDDDCDRSTDEGSVLDLCGARADACNQGLCRCGDSDACREDRRCNSGQCSN